MLYDWYLRHKKLGIALAVAVLVIATAVIGVGTALQGGSGGSAATVSCWGTSQDGNVVLNTVEPVSDGLGACGSQPNLIMLPANGGDIGPWSSTSVSNPGTEACDLAPGSGSPNANTYKVYATPGDTSSGSEASGLCMFFESEKR